jgi:hypothetical protein
MDYKNFFKEITGGNYTHNNHEGGILHHWVWDKVDKVDEIGNFLIKKGYTFQERYPTSGMISGAMPRHITRVEMHSLSEYNFTVEYFDGDGSMYCNHYYNAKKIIDLFRNHEYDKVREWERRNKSGKPKTRYSNGCTE